MSRLVILLVFCLVLVSLALGQLITEGGEGINAGGACKRANGMACSDTTQGWEKVDMKRQVRISETTDPWVWEPKRQRLAKVGREQKEDGDNNLGGRGWFRRQAMQWGHKGWAKRQAQLNEGWKSVNDDKGWAKRQAQLNEGWKSVNDDKGWAKPQAQIYEGWKSVDDDKGWAKPQAQMNEGWKSVNDDKGWAKRQAQLNEGWESANYDKGWAKRQAQLNDGWMRRRAAWRDEGKDKSGDKDLRFWGVAGRH